MSLPAPIRMKFMAVGEFCAATGFTRKTVDRYISTGRWLKYQLWVGDSSVPSINLDGYHAWVERRPLPEIPEFCKPRRKPSPGEHHRRRRGAVKNQTPRWANRRAIDAIYAEARRLTIETGVPHQVDHIVPLLGRSVSGLHVEYNLRIVTATENAAKSNRHQ